MKAGPGLKSGHVSVGVQTPSGSFESPLSYNHLSLCEYNKMNTSCCRNECCAYSGAIGETGAVKFSNTLC